jgi:tetratricopeptide (TPR) repeat protein
MFALPVRTALPLVLFLLLGRVAASTDDRPAEAADAWKVALAESRRAAQLVNSNELAGAKASLNAFAERTTGAYARRARMLIQQLGWHSPGQGDGPASEHTCDLRSKVLLELGDFEAATGWLNAACSAAHPSRVNQYRQRLAWTLAAGGKLDEALAEYEKLKPSDESRVRDIADQYAKRIATIRGKRERPEDVAADLEFVREHLLEGAEPFRAVPSYALLPAIERLDEALARAEKEFDRRGLHALIQ